MTDDIPTKDLVADLGIEVPAWVDRSITARDVAAIIQRGCDSQTYAPVATYNTARRVMDHYGDEVLDFIRSRLGNVPPVPQEVCWSGVPAFFLSVAVEKWAESAADEIQNQQED